MFSLANVRNLGRLVKFPLAVVGVYPELIEVAVDEAGRGYRDHVALGQVFEFYGRVD